MFWCWSDGERVHVALRYRPDDGLRELVIRIRVKMRRYAVLENRGYTDANSSSRGIYNHRDFQVVLRSMYFRCFLTFLTRHLSAPTCLLKFPPLRRAVVTYLLSCQYFPDCHCFQARLVFPSPSREVPRLARM